MRVLVAEDEDSIREIYEIVLKDAGHEVTSTKDGQECLDVYLKEKAAARSFDVVITDLRMPRKDGIAVITEILKENPNQKIFVATAYSKEVSGTLGDLIGKVKVIRKPFDLDVLLEALNSAG